MRDGNKWMCKHKKALKKNLQKFFILYFCEFYCGRKNKMKKIFWLPETNQNNKVGQFTSKLL